MSATSPPILRPSDSIAANGTAQPAFELRWPVEAPLHQSLSRRVCCIVPCYNVAALCLPVITACADHVGRVVAIDDGSTDETPRYLAEARQLHPDRVDVLTHQPNRGKGVALMRGFTHALEQTDCDVILTTDGDGQHRAGDIPRIARPALENRGDLVIGQRQFPHGVPTRSRIGNNLSAAVVSAVYRNTPRDTQCGLRAHRRELIQDMVAHVAGNRYDTEASILLRSLFLKKRIVQVPIPAIYHGKNESSHYRPLTDSLRILRAFFLTVALPELGVPMRWLER